MKKLAVGCLVVFVVLAVGAGIATYYVYHKARSYLRQFEELTALDQNVSNTTPFTAPADGELTDDMVKRFIAVQESMHAKLGKRVEELTAMQDEFLRRQQAEQRQSTSVEDIKNVTAMMGFVLQAKNAWVDALNQERFSLDEYYWVRGRVYAAAGLSIAELSLRDLPDALEQGGAVMHRIAESGDPVPRRNTELVTPYLPKLKDWAVLAFFGL